MMTLPIWAFISICICCIPTLLILITAIIALIYRLADRNYNNLEDNDCPYKVEASNEDYEN